MCDDIPKVPNDDIFNEFVQQLITLRKALWTELNCSKCRFSGDVKNIIDSIFIKILTSLETAIKGLKDSIKLIEILLPCIQTGLDDSDYKLKEKFNEIDYSFGRFLRQLDAVRRNCQSDTLNEEIKRTCVVGGLLFSKEVGKNLHGCFSDIVKD